jgi:hypothetical protein
VPHIGYDAGSAAIFVGEKILRSLDSIQRAVKNARIAALTWHYTKNRAHPSTHRGFPGKQIIRVLDDLIELIHW